MIQEKESAYLHNCLQGNLTAIKRYITSGGNINVTEENDTNASQLAAVGGHLKVLKYLIDQGCDEGTTKRSSPFFLAAQYGHLNIVQWYVTERKFDVNKHNDFGDTLLLTACQGKADVVRFLLNISKSTIDTPNQANTYPIHAAVKNSKGSGLEIFKLLSDAGADLNVQSDGKRLLHSAAFWNRPQIIQFLIEDKKMDPNIPTQDSGAATPLHFAASNEALEAGNMLISHGADINARTALDLDVFAVACTHGKIKFAKMILPKANINNYYRTCCKMTPLYGAAQKGNFEVVQFLLDHGADDTLEASLCEQHATLCKTVIGIANAKQHHKIVKHLEAMRLSKITSQNLLDKENEERIEKEKQETTEVIKPKKKKKKKKRAGIAVPAKILISLPESSDEPAQENNPIPHFINVAREHEKFIDCVPLRNDRPGFKKTFIYLYKSKNSGLFTESAQNTNIISPFLHSIDNIGSSIANNFLHNAGYSLHVETKENLPTDHYHNITRTIDEKYGDWARIIVHDFKCNPAKKEYWAQQLGTEKVQDFWFELRGSIYARIHKDKYPEEKARTLGPTGVIEYIILAENLTKSGKRVIVHRCFKHD